jgi:hypothetical protein
MKKESSVARNSLGFNVKTKESLKSIIHIMAHFHLGASRIQLRNVIA